MRCAPARSTRRAPRARARARWALSPLILFALSCMEEAPSELGGREGVALPPRLDQGAAQRGDWEEATRDGETQRDRGSSGADAGAGEGGAAPATLARLTRRQYRNIIRDIFGPEISITTVLEEETPLHGFASVGVRELTLSPLAVEQYEQAAQEITGQLFDERGGWRRLIPCEQIDAAPDGCVADALGRLGRRLWRRTLEGEERALLLTLFSAGVELRGGPEEGLQHAIEFLLQSPDFLFRVELGEPDPEREGGRRFTSEEIASRLSFLLWDSAPDEALLERAEGGELYRPEGRLAALEELRASPKSEEALLAFFREYFHFDRLDLLQKDREAFPLMSDELGGMIREGVERFIRQTIFEEQSDLRALLTSRSVWVNHSLAALYQLDSAAQDGWWQTDFPARSPRAGLLTRAAFLALNAHNTVTSPTLRGKYIQNKFFCVDIPPPPPGVTTSLESPEGEAEAPQTTREKLARHREDPSCAGCHQAMDPMGLMLENFDALGIWRTTEAGLPVDASGEIAGERLSGALALSDYLTRDTRFPDCVAQHFYRFAQGALEGPDDEQTITALQDALADAQFRFDALLEAYVMSASFIRAGEPR